MWKYLNKVELFCLLFRILIVGPESQKVHPQLHHDTFPDLAFFYWIFLSVSLDIRVV